MAIYKNGTDGDDSLLGTGEDEVMYGYAGADSIYGLGGSDTIWGFEGNDSLLRGDSGDLLAGGDGADTLVGGVGADTMYGHDGSDTYYVDDLNDLIQDWGSFGTDSLHVSISGFLVPDDIESVHYAPGVEPVAYFLSALLTNGHGYWGPFGNAATLPFSFATSATGGESGFELFTDSQKAYVREALGRFSAVTNVSFVESPDSLGVVMRFFRDDLTSAGHGSSGGYAHYPTDGDVHINRSLMDMSPGGSGFSTLLHEIGHALGLKHPHQGKYTLRASEDNKLNTVMSYVHVTPTVQDLGMFDIAALHYMFGPRAATRTGDDIYRISDRYISDGGGVDTFSAAEQAGAVTVDLAPGGWSHVGARNQSLLAEGQAFVGYGTMIENAIGGLGADDVRGNSMANRLIGGTGQDRLQGFEGADRLFGGEGADTLDGGKGTDTMTGGDGADTYRVHNSADLVVETNTSPITGGIDVVWSYMDSYALSANVEHGRILRLAGGSLTGNSLANRIVLGPGNDSIAGAGGGDTASFEMATAAVNVSLSLTGPQATGGSGSDRILGFEHLVGSAYGDVLTGSLGANRIDGGTGADTLDGGSGVDTMNGGDGADTYLVNDSNDLVVESNSSATTGGIDTVWSYLATYTLGNNVENGLIMLETGASLTGNSSDNRIYAGPGNDSISGAEGLDTANYAEADAAVRVSLSASAVLATGGSGSDMLEDFEYLVGSAYNDTLTGSSVSNRLEGGLGADWLRGVGGADTLVGSGGADTLAGGGSADSLVGGSGADLFDFNSTAESGTSSTSRDRIADFSAAAGDKIDLSSLDANQATTTNDAFQTLQSGSYVDGSRFTVSVR